MARQRVLVIGSFWFLGFFLVFDDIDNATAVAGCREISRYIFLDAFSIGVVCSHVAFQNLSASEARDRESK